MYDSCVRGDGQKPQLEYFRLFDFFFFKLSGHFINFLDVEVFFFSSHLLLFSCPLSHPRPPSSLNSQDQTVQVQESFIPPPPSVFLPSAFLLSLLPPPPSSSCQLPLPSLFPPFLWWRMEKHSSINSPDNCPAALLLPALGHSVHLHRFTSSLLNLCFFFLFFFYSVAPHSTAFFVPEKKTEKKLFFQPLSRDGSQAQHSGQCWFFRKCKWNPEPDPTAERKSRTQQFFFFARCDFSLCFSQAVPEDGRQEILQVCFSPQRSRCRNKDQNKPPAAAALNYYSHNYFYTETGEQW